MGKRELRVIAVPKGVTVTLLVVTSAAMLTFFGLLSQHAFVRPTGSTADLIVRVVSAQRAGTLSVASGIATLWPVAANLALFVPWGFLMFLAIDRPERPRASTYAVTLLAGIAFAGVIQLWDMFMPMRVTTASDALANCAGAFCGAMLGHLRKQVQVRFNP